MPYVRKGKCVYKKGDETPIKCHATEKAAIKHMQALNINVKSTMDAASGIISAIQILQDGKPQLTTVYDQAIIGTGIEYPLSTGPTTFTKEDLSDAVAAQDDPCVPRPRLWLGHTDDKRIHGDRTTGVPSGEPAVGVVRDMRLEHDGHLIRANLVGVPLWLGNILSSAFPSRSIEGKFNFKTPTGHKWRLVISELALLGVKWPGVTSLEDVASLYTPEGPQGVIVTEATEEQPVAAVTEIGLRNIAGQVTVEDLRRAWYDHTHQSGNNDQQWWWIRSIYLEPNELICDDDDGNLYRVGFNVKDEEVEFEDPSKVKIKYVNASHGGIEQVPINEGRVHVAQFNNRADSRPVAVRPGSLEVPLAAALKVGKAQTKASAAGDTLTIKLGV